MTDLTQQQIDKLHDEVKLGEKAERAYELYIKDFIARAKQNTFDAFEACGAEDKDRLHKLKLMSAGVSALEVSVHEDINTMKMAMQQLNELKDGK